VTEETEPESEPRTRRRLRLTPMVPRDTEEEHRASTPLELLFDLCFVVAVSQAASHLDEALSLNHLDQGITGYLTVFFAIWWAWVNFTWFASAYDVDDVAYRLLTFVQIIGVLILAAGINKAFVSNDYGTITLGYVVMRLALITQWLRAASGDPAGRRAALRYAVGIGILQIGWVVRLFLPHDAAIAMFYVLAAAEMAVPALAERKAEGGQGTNWHPGHINERYGLFTLIVLGECIASATLAIQAASEAHGISTALIGVTAGALMLVFAVWWWYFEHPAEQGLRMSRQVAFIWGYGHYGVFASVAALGAGLDVAAQVTRHATAISPTTAGLAIAVALSVYLVVTGALQARLDKKSVVQVRVVVAIAVLILVVGAAARPLTIGVAVPLMGLIVVALVVGDQVHVERLAQPKAGPPTP
jgi:low temperature requirement protein LtrA